MNYTQFSRKQLIDKIESLQLLNKELLKEKEQETRLEYSWSGNLGHWYWNIKKNEVTFNPLKVIVLGYDLDEIPEHVTYQFFTDKVHPEDYQKTMDAMKNHIYGIKEVYEVEYRIKTKDGTYKWFYDRGKITQVDGSGKPVFLAGIVFDITEKKEMELELEFKNRILLELSSIDDLTKIANRRTLIEQLELEVEKVKLTSSPLSIAIFDIDDFKKVNDAKGHVFGDQVLVDIASIVKESIRATDFAGRYGGEEFMIIYPATNLPLGEKITERIRQAIENYTFGDDLKLTISGGVGEYNNVTIIDFINTVDKKLYFAKRNGKNMIVSGDYSL